MHLASPARNTRLARLWLCLFALLLSAAHMAAAQAYTSIVVLGDSLSDTGNDAALTNAKYGFSAQVPGPLTGYTNGRFTDGTDTLPPARNYTGVWIEQLAAQLAAKPAVTASLAGGRNYAYGYATTNTGTSQLTYGPANAFSVNVNNMGQQLSDYLASGPTINSSTLYVVWGGANDLLNATSSATIVAAATREAGIVQALIAAGATDILVPNLPPLGLIPRLNGNAAAAAQATAAAQGFNQALSAALAQVQQAAAGKTLRLYQLDVYTLFNTVVGPPIGYGFANVTASSQGNATVNPDTYLFWDDLHPTTYGHSLIAAAALRLLGTPVTTMTNLAALPSSLVNLGTNVALTATVAAATLTSGTPVGTVTFRDGSTVLATVLVSASSSSNATAVYNTASLTAGLHTITATFTGVNGYSGSTSPTINVSVIAPGYTAALSPTTIGIPRGNSGFATLTITPVGGYTGSFTVACGSVAGLQCSIGTSSLTTTGAAVTTTVNISTVNAAAALRKPALPFLPATPQVEYAVLGLSLLSGLGLARRHARTLRSAALLLLPVLLSLAVLLGISGCGGSGNSSSAATGTYSIPITITPSSGTAQTVTLTVNVI